MTPFEVANSGLCDDARSHARSVPLGLPYSAVGQHARYPIHQYSPYIPPFLPSSLPYIPPSIPSSPLPSLLPSINTG